MCRGMYDLKICCPNLKDIRVFGMDLKSIDISGMRLEDVRVSYCFVNCIDGSEVDIFAPNLKSFAWVGNVITDKCSIQSFPVLKRSEFLWPHITTKKISNNSVIDLFSSSSQVEELTITFDFLRILSEIYFEFGGLPFSFMKLIKTLDIYPDKRYFPARGIACLFKSSIVHRLRIHLFMDSYEENYDEWTDLDYANSTEKQYCETRAQYLSPFLSHLKVVDINLGNMIPENAVTFAKFFLKYGRGLQKVNLRFCRGKSNLPPNLLKDIKGLPRASADVEISISCY
ncbi:putative F-box/FBD/LRR-repeat protein At4g03220 [Rosa rugosa]|uniref:putative F-box/FBD/LRR-repeat protein At4g03220 n=1 Tax=Rosa rugosa TaxID=74645 RepID=UPI002B404FB5|nr:putative F-box/FBD/LRR-repeat protein At4g03220 [Rosa rugosa]